MDGPFRTDFEVGRVVRVTSKDCPSRGMQGMVVGHNPGFVAKPIRVWIGREGDPKLGELSKSLAAALQREREFALDPPPPERQWRDIRTRDFAESDLEICSEGWTVQTLAKRFFGQEISFFLPAEPFEPRTEDCGVNGCTRTAEKLIVVKVTRVVVPIGVCEICAPRYRGLTLPSNTFKAEPLNKAREQAAKSRPLVTAS